MGFRGEDQYAYVIPMMELVRLIGCNRIGMSYLQLE